MAIDLDAPAMLLIGPEVALASCALREALAVAIALDESELRRAAILYFGGDELTMPGILAVAEASNIKLHNGELPRSARATISS
ncbi:hypothetical protein ACFB49_30900 [Sphingomonas sp. DBB INV C78]|uniref:hypothetical protein n=1 Tax=Sphingomonas sp. DBB INV C78 TaxID=3349434 RepID=UPI0036D28209